MRARRPLPAQKRSWSTIPVGRLNRNPQLTVQAFNFRALLVSEGHRRKKSGDWTGGGPFFQESATLTHTGALSQNRVLYFGIDSGARQYAGVGGLQGLTCPWYGSDLYGVGNTISGAKSKLIALQGNNYVKGYLRTAPGGPEASLGQFLVELRDFPKVPGIKLLQALRGSGGFKGVIPAVKRYLWEFVKREGAGEYLNYQFGWRPFINDLRQIYHLFKNIDTSIQQLIRENDKAIRRRATLENSVVETEHNTWGNTHHYEPVYYCGGYGDSPVATGETYIRSTTKTEKKVWFVAGYQYHIPDTSSWLWKGRAYAALFGVLPTPGLVWAVTPWSWLVDWVTDVGNLYDYFSPRAVDNLVTRYAFTMRNTKVTETWTADTRIDARFLQGVHEWDGTAGRLSSVLLTETKERGSGWALFGPGLEDVSLSGKQLSILAALGITRAKVR